MSHPSAPPPPLRIPVRREYLSLLRTGEKTIEGRLAKPTYLTITAGRKLTFFSSGDDEEEDEDSLDMLVVGVTLHASFREMLEAYSVGAVLPLLLAGEGEEEGDVVARAVEVYRGFPGYREGEGVFGVCAIAVKAVGF